ncbi:hypothetical protein ACJRO7_021517 [Eucalyptus globulus]|uniref:F-box domain-containing protein n=1 Tax=Eucalyptus globulus TaxID=34317 RepID=A0ABD3KKV7_EUCGL
MASAAKEVDHISRLRDVIIHRIFSFLPFKDVVTTSVLSKQWRFAWTSIPYIDLSLPSKGVVPSIDRAVRLCNASKIERFQLDAIVVSEIDRALGLCTASKIEKFHLDANSLGSERMSHELHRTLCDCASLVSLRESGCHLSGDAIINWPSLKKNVDCSVAKDVIIDSFGSMRT